MRLFRALLLAGLILAPALARPRSVVVVAPIPQGQFPPPWTENIHISLEDADTAIQDHRRFPRAARDFRAVLKGPIGNRPYQVEVLCMDRGEKRIAVFRQPVRILPDTKKIKLDKLKFIELIKT